MKTINIIAIIIVSTLSAVFIFSAIPSDIWKDQRTDFIGVSPPGELDEKIDCLSKGGVWDYTRCNFEEPESQSTIQFKAKQLGIDNIMEATDAKELSYDEKLEYIKFQYGEDGPSTTPSLNLRIKDLTRNLEYGQLPTFTLIETGYANPCTAPKLEVYFIKEEIGYDLENDELIFEDTIVYSCPYFDKFYPVLNFWSEKDFPSFPACVNEGRYLIVGDSGTERVALDEYYCNPK